MSKFRKRAEQYETFFDRFRANLQSNFQLTDWDVLEQRMIQMDRAALIAIYLKFISRLTGNIRDLQLAKFILDNTTQGPQSLMNFHAAINEANHLNTTLPVSVSAGSIIDSIFDEINAADESVQRAIMTPPQQPLFSQREPTLIGSIAVRNYFKFTHFATAIGACSRYAMATKDSELFLMESDLAEEVLDSNNEPLEAEDLDCLPYNRFMVEFSTPLKMFNYDLIGVSFYKSPVKPYRVMGWIFRNPDSTENTLLDSLVVVGKLMFVLDNVQSAPRVEKLSSAESQIISQRSRNLWDFLTSRNIDYEIIHRPQHDWSRFRRYQHMQRMYATVRDVRLLKVNRRVTHPDGENPAPQQLELSYRVKVPGAFHKWVYCKSCGRVHRHDLVGSPCRRCTLPVGPFSNIVVKKYWHSPYVIGPDSAPLREVVREISN